MTATATSGWWTLAEAAAESGYSRWQIREWSRRSERKAFRVRLTRTGELSRGRCIHSADFLRWLEGRVEQVR